MCFDFSSSVLSCPAFCSEACRCCTFAKKKKGVMAQNKHEIGKTVGLQKFSHFLSLSSAIAHSLHFLVFLKSLLTVSFT